MATNCAMLQLHAARYLRGQGSVRLGSAAHHMHAACRTGWQ